LFGHDGETSWVEPGLFDPAPVNDAATLEPLEVRAWRIVAAAAELVRDLEGGDRVDALLGELWRLERRTYDAIERDDALRWIVPGEALPALLESLKRGES